MRTIILALIVCAPLEARAQTSSWQASGGVESFTYRDVARSRPPIDGSPVAWRGSGPTSGTIAYVAVLRFRRSDRLGLPKQNRSGSRACRRSATTCSASWRTKRTTCSSSTAGPSFYFTWTRTHRAQLPHVSRLVNDDEWLRVDTETTYRVSASFLAWLLATYGPDRFRQIYRASSGEFEDRVMSLYGRSLDALETEWLRFTDSFAG